MIRKQFLLSCLWIAAISVVASSGDAEARCRCGYGGGRGWRQANYTYATNGGYGTYYATNNGTLSNQSINQTSANGTAVQTNGNYSVNRPSYDESMPINNGNNNGVPANSNPDNRPPNPALINSSPDPDNEGRNASKIPGTAPTKAPAPPANAAP